MRRVAIAVLCLAAACSKPPSAPSSPPSAPVGAADFSGYWSGTFNYQACVGAHCSARIERNDRFSLRLRQTLNHVAGVFATEIRGSIEVAGDVQPDGSLVLNGSEDTGGRTGLAGFATFAAPALRLDPATGLTGRMRLERTVILGPLDRYSSLADGTIVSATRQNLDLYLADLSGTWRGFYLVRECVDELGRPLCGMFRGPGEVEQLELTLGLGGAGASGELTPVSTRIPVSGSTRGRTIELAGVREELGGRVVDRITALSGSVDDFGRLKGSFAYVRVFDGRTATATVDLLQVVRIP